MAVLHDPALVALALVLLGLGAAPALLALASDRHDAKPAGLRPTPGGLPVAVPVGAAAAVRIAEAYGLVPVTGIAWRGRAWSVQAPDGCGGSMAAAVCPWTGQIGAPQSV